MPQDRFLIAPFESGWQNNLKPWLIADDAFETLENAYVWRGRVKKRVGGRLMGQGGTDATAPLLSRFRRDLGLTLAGGNITVAGLTPTNVGMQFSIGDQIYTVVDITPGAQPMLNTGGGTATFDSATGTVAITGATAGVGITLWFYPALPVMRLDNYQDNAEPVNASYSIGLDTNNIYWYPPGGGGWDEFLTNPVFPNGTINHFIDSTSWTSTFNNNIFFATSFDGSNTGAMFYWNNTGFVVTAFEPIVSVNTVGAVTTTVSVLSCRMIRVWRNLLLLINVVEHTLIEEDGQPDINTYAWYPSRIRFSAFDDPISANAFIEPPSVNYTGGDRIDLPTQEEILGADFLGDRLIIFCEQSTWEAVYRGNYVQPFSYIQLNNNYGGESPQSTITFERNVMTVGSNSFTICDGGNVTRLDSKIPNEIFKIKNAGNGPLRVSGVWDKYNMLLYWATPFDDQQADQIWPSVVFVFNPENKTWAINDDAITAFGYYENQPSFTWADWVIPWDQSTWTWGSGQNQSFARQTIAGNQEGFTFIVDRNMPRNAKVLQITDMTNIGGGIVELTIIDHMLNNEDFILIENATASLARAIYEVTYVDTDTIRIAEATFLGAYTGGGWATRVSEIDIWTKQINPYKNKGYNVHLSKVNFAVTRTSFGEITANYYSSSSSVNNNPTGIATGAQLGDNILVTTPYPEAITGSSLEEFQEKLWHPITFQGVGDVIQINLFLADDANIADSQIRNINIALSDFELQGMILYTQPAANRMQ
jgi:hypothetical protein